MPQAVAIPAIATAVTGLGAAAIGARSSSKAGKASQAANDAALAFQREESAKEEARYKAQQLAQIQAWNDYNRTMEPARRRKAQFLGIEYRAPATIPPEGWTAPVQAAPSAPPTLGGLAGKQIPGGNVTAALQAPEIQGGFESTLGSYARPMSQFARGSYR